MVRKNKILLIFLILLIIGLGLGLGLGFGLSHKEEISSYVPPDDMFPYATSLSDKDIQGLKEGQRIMTEMLRVFDQICRRHHIRYWCMGGTLIGAIRHKGWIPWDGDLRCIYDA